MYNSDEQKKQNELLEKEKERERDKSKERNKQRNEKKARDEEIAFQEIIYAMNEMNILEAMFPNYAREYHEKHHDNDPAPQSQHHSEQLSHQQSMRISSPRHNTT